MKNLSPTRDWWYAYIDNSKHAIDKLVIRLDTAEELLYFKMGDLKLSKLKCKEKCYGNAKVKKKRKNPRDFLLHRY